MIKYWVQQCRGKYRCYACMCICVWAQANMCTQACAEEAVLLELTHAEYG